MKTQAPEDRALRGSLFDNTLDGLAYCQMVFDAQRHPIDFIFIEVNKNFESLTGLKDAVGKKVTELIPGIFASNPDLFEIYGRVALTGKRENFETYVAPLSRWFLVSTYSPKEEFFVAIFQNITVRKQIENDLKDARKAASNVLADLQTERDKLVEANSDLKKFKLALDNTSDRVTITDPDGVVLYCNPATEKITGYKSEEVIGKKAGTLWHLPMPKEYYENLWDTIRSKKTAFRGDLKNRRKNGEIYDAFSSISPVLNEKNEVIFFVEVERDVTKERAAAEADERLAAIIRDTNDAIISFNLDGKISSWNNGAERMYGYEEKEVMGKDARGLLILKDRYKETDEILNKIKDGERIENYETQRIRKDGKVFDANITYSPIHDQNGSVIAVSVITRDITKEKEADKVKSEFVSIASHQLRTPLTGIQWVVERFTKKEELTPKGKEYLNDIHVSVKRLTELVDLLLNLSRIEGGRVGITPEQVEVIGSVKSFIDEVTPLLDKKELKIVFEDHPEELAVETDKSVMRNVIQNLISNAIEYSSNGGRIDVAVQRKDDKFTIKVRDAGIGIPRSEQSRIFEKFMRASNAKLYKTEGTGIGLYIVEQSVNRLGGKIWFESEENKGSTFYVELPLDFKSQEEQRPLSQ